MERLINKLLCVSEMSCRGQFGIMATDFIFFFKSTQPVSSSAIDSSSDVLFARVLDKYSDKHS